VARPTRADLRDATENLGKRADLESMLGVIRAPDEAARRWYALWRERYPIDDMDIHAMKLVPRLLARLRELGITDDETQRLTGIVRYLWAQSEVMMAGARVVAKILRQSGIDVVAIKGVALHQEGLVKPHERPMVDADLVVDEARYQEAVRILRANHWQEKSALGHATTLKKGKAEVDLHRLVVRQDRRFSLADWGRLPKEPFGLLGPTGNLLVTCLHGMRADGGGLWVLDAEAIVKTNAINWVSLIAHARTRVLVLTLASALARVRGVPDYVHERLFAEPATHIEALELRHHAVKFDRHGDIAARVLERLRTATANDTIQVKMYEDANGMRWDHRWSKEWR
jgi:hypothetical protein